MTFSTYLAGTQSCAYDRIRITPSGFNSSYTQPEPQLTPEQHATVVSIAEGDARVNEILSGNSYTVGDIVPWTRVQTNLLLGAEITFTWTAPTSIDYDWPGVYYDYTETTNPPYSEGTSSYSASNVTSIAVLVDLTRGLVVSIQPGLDAVVEEPHALRALRAHTSESGHLPRRLQMEMIPDDLGGYQADRMQTVCLEGTCFRNYDFTKSGRYNGMRPDRVDWPVDLIFWNGAFINRVKDAMCGDGGSGMDYCDTGSTMYASIKDGSNAPWTWDEDRGIKTMFCPGPGMKTPHMRL